MSRVLCGRQELFTKIISDGAEFHSAPFFITPRPTFGHPVLDLLHAHRVSHKLLRNNMLNLFAIRTRFAPSVRKFALPTWGEGTSTIHLSICSPSFEGRGYNFWPLLGFTAPRDKRQRSQSQRKLDVSADSCSPLTTLVPLLGFPPTYSQKLTISLRLFIIEIIKRSVKWHNNLIRKILKKEYQF